MKPIRLASIIMLAILSSNVIFAQEDDVPYLSDEDIIAIEMVLPDDVPAVLQEKPAETAAVTNETIKDNNEISRINASQRIYHLLILDRKSCALNADISDIKNMEVLYKFRHGTNGYLIAIYMSPQEGPVFPKLPDRSRIIVNLMTARINTIKEYVDSVAFKRFVKNTIITSQIKAVLETIFDS